MISCVQVRFIQRGRCVTGMAAYAAGLAVPGRMVSARKPRLPALFCANARPGDDGLNVLSWQALSPASLLRLMAGQDVRGDPAHGPEDGSGRLADPSGAYRWAQGDEHADDLIGRDPMVKGPCHVLVIPCPGLPGRHQGGQADQRMTSHIQPGLFDIVVR